MSIKKLTTGMNSKIGINSEKETDDLLNKITVSEKDLKELFE